LLMPLLLSLGYSDSDIDPKVPITFQTGRKGRKHEADFVVYSGSPHIEDTSLIVVEAKPPEADLEQARRQAESYAHATRAPFLLISDGVALEIWQMQPTRSSERTFSCRVRELDRHRGVIEQVLGRNAAAAHCRILGYRSMSDVVDDVSAYVSAELTRTEGGSSIARRLGAGGDPRSAIEVVNGSPRGAIVLAPSGFGKTTLAIDLVRNLLATMENDGPVPFLISLPDLVQLGQTPDDYARDRLAARCPQFATSSTFADLLDRRGAHIICDGLDRIDYKEQRLFLAQAAKLMRDRPNVRLILLGRTAVQNALDLPVFDLLPLSWKEKDALAALISDRGPMALHRIPPQLTSLTEHPLLLTLILQSHERSGKMPERLEELFEAWLAGLLEVDGNSPAAVVRLRDLLARFAVSVLDPTRSRAEVLDEITPDSADFDSLISAGALIVGTRIELLHDALADYLRADAMLALPAGEMEKLLPGASFGSGSLFPALLMSKCHDPRMRDAIWRQAGEAGLDVYADILRFGGATDDTVPVADIDADEAYLREFHKGVMQPIRWYLSAIERQLTSALTGARSGELGIVGRLNADESRFSYGFFARKDGEAPVLVGRPADRGTLRRTTLGLVPDTRYARRLGYDCIREALKTVILRRELLGGPLWMNERLLGRLRFANRIWRTEIPLDTDLGSLLKFLEPRKGEWVSIDGFGDRSWTVGAMIEDATTLAAAGYSALDPWWLKFGWDHREEVIDFTRAAPLLDEYWRRTQLILGELVVQSLPRLAKTCNFFQAMPVRFDVKIGYIERYGQSMNYSWLPVAEWNRAGADVAGEGDDSYFDSRSYDRIMSELARLGRPGCTSVVLANGRMPRFDGSHRDRGFDGETPALRNALSFLAQDLDLLLDRLPGRERLKNKCAVGA